MAIEIREIQHKDDMEVAKVIRSVLEEFGVPKVGTAYADKCLDSMTDTYNKAKAVYYVLDSGGTLFGGAGIAKLDNFDGNVCELQKMYFLKAVRGKGLGAKMMERCLEAARSFGYEKCYLETLPYMEDAQKLYKKFGFEALEVPMGDTCHYSCNVWMIKNL
ncbi:MAG TPA: GNAT family N-acetyltransferase [Aquaticitalea sp.]|nr:GNAT family N-acetyltransferase [Aquaticitalea sp.]HNU58941.1 GNAT family N-acetyltransferase [Aquaticitalea sp.]